MINKLKDFLKLLLILGRLILEILWILPILTLIALVNSKEEENND